MTQAEGYFEKYHHDGILFYHNFLMPLYDTVGLHLYTNCFI
jgi:hypothetical protein